MSARWRLRSFGARSLDLVESFRRTLWVFRQIKRTPPCIGTDANCQLIQQWEPPTLKLVPSGISRSANSGQGWARGLLQPRHVAHSLSILHPAKGYVAKHAHCVRTYSFQHQSRETSLCKTREPDRRPLAARVGQVETAELLLQLRSRDWWNRFAAFCGSSGSIFVYIFRWQRRSLLMRFEKKGENEN